MSTKHDGGGKSPRENEGEKQQKGLGRRPGSASGRIVVRDDFDDPLPEEMLAAFGVGRETGCGTDGDDNNEGEA